MKIPLWHWQLRVSLYRQPTREEGANSHFDAVLMRETLTKWNGVILPVKMYGLKCVVCDEEHAGQAHGASPGEMWPSS